MTLLKKEDKKGISVLSGTTLAIAMLLVFFSFAPSMTNIIIDGANRSSSDPLVSISIYFLLPFMLIVLLIIAVVLMRG